ncbi:glycogen debranching protein GlgX [Glaciecola petra]|uniref:Glycogen debranching protein GlgX n=1 Tax=Glaciecola petra TaxID=3075602 RepID=A0ABU2ZRH0_9ALTE|nr:glycogen debranching protein GlgX [Aestuariibacter sp. P117]MDT0594037.1 glycogen debranching protein GlgX [Aestuariibacter sp. P117]
MSLKIATSINRFVLQTGSLFPAGAKLTENGCNFSIYAPDAAQVFICLYDENEEEIARILLQQRIQSRWFGFIKGVGTEHLYGLRVKPKSNRSTNPDSSLDKLLIDPYAQSLNRPLTWSAEKYAGDSHALVPKAKLFAQANSNLRPLGISDEKRVIYEAHVKGLTQLHPSIPEQLRGKYLGACEPAIIEHLKQLGVTSIQFLPLMAFMPEPFITLKGLTNYWGYNPINFFAAEPRYANNDAVTECKEMIARFRAHNIEVILDVVFNHTCESGADGPVLSFKGLFESHAYLLEQNDETDQAQHLNYSGCGNTLKVSDPYMLSLVVDALRYWVSEMGVSGFRFDLASVAGREIHEFKNSAAFFKVLRQDPLLRTAVMIAEPWDIGPGGYQLGQYPDYWLEVNDKFRDVVRGFWRGDKGLKGEFATRLMGSRDIFRKNTRPMHASVNNVTYHDGYTLHDIVSFENKHNLDNLEENRDGHNHNLSANYGIEGETNDSLILDMRERQKRNLFATLVLSQGTPHILAGDELSKTQNGNNNAYCQDNEINWLDWEMTDRKAQFLTFCQYVINLRAKNRLLQQMHFDDDMFDNRQNIKVADWYRRDGSHKTDIDWVNHEHHCFALHLIGEDTLHYASAEHPSNAINVKLASDASKEEQWLLCINSLHDAREFHLPVLEAHEKWVCVLDTSVSDISKYRASAIDSIFNMPARTMRLYCNK